MPKLQPSLLRVSGKGAVSRERVLGLGVRRDVAAGSWLLAADVMLGLTAHRDDDRSPLTVNRA